MSDILGVPHTLGLTDINSQILQANRGIEASNRNNKARYTQSLKDSKTPKTKDDVGTTILDAKESGTGAIGGTDIYELGGVARNVKDFASKTPAEALGVPERATALGTSGAEGTSTGITLLDAGSTGLSNIVNAKAVPEADNAITVLNAGSGGLSNLVQGKASEDVVYATHVNPEAAAIGNAGNLAKDSEGLLKAATPELKTLGTFGKATAGLQIGMGAYDAFEDISHRKIAGDGFEKTSNIADMVGGAAAGLFALGTALDLTGVGAPVGMALQGVAGIASLVGGAADFLEDEKKKNAPATPTPAAAAAAAAPRPVPQAVMSFQAGGSTGQEVKVN